MADELRPIIHKLVYHLEEQDGLEEELGNPIKTQRRRIKKHKLRNKK